MKKIQGCLFATYLLLSGCSPVESLAPFDNKQITAMINENHELKKADQRIRFPLAHPKTWQRIDVSSDKKGSPIVFIPANQTLSNAHEKISTWISAYLYQPNINAKTLAENNLAALKKYCDNVTMNIISSDKTELMYRMDISHCAYQPDRVQINHAFNGRDAVYVIRYTGDLPVSEERIQSMQRMIAKAELVGA